MPANVLSPCCCQLSRVTEVAEDGPVDQTMGEAITQLSGVPSARAQGEEMSMHRVVEGVMVAILLLTVFTPGEAWATATLKGQVVLNRERGEPVAGVAVSADGANLLHS
jgi:hypothetical protein